MTELLTNITLFFKKPRYNTDSFGTKLIYRGQVLFCLIAAVSTLANNYLGTQITCKTLAGHQPDFDSYCFNAGTTIYGELREDVTYSHVEIYPNVRGNHDIKVRPGPGLQSESNPLPAIVLLNHVIWYPYILFGIVFLLYLPRFRWRSVQGQIIEEIVRNLRDTNLTERQIEDTVHIASGRFAQDRREHKMFLLKYSCVLVVNMCTLCAIDLFLIEYVGRGNPWFALEGLQYLDSPYEEYPLSLAMVFPQRSSCERLFFGIGGSLQNETGLCELHYGRLNQFFMCSTFWFTLFNAANMAREILWILLKIYFPAIGRFVCVWNLNVKRDSDVYRLINRLDCGSVFVIELLAKNLHKHRLIEILIDVKFEVENQGVALERRMDGNV